MDWFIVIAHQMEQDIPPAAIHSRGFNKSVSLLLSSAEQPRDFSLFLLMVVVVVAKTLSLLSNNTSVAFYIAHTNNGRKCIRRVSPQPSLLQEENDYRLAIVELSSEFLIRHLTFYQK